MPDLSAREQKAMADLLAYHHLQEEAIRPDGNCLYAAFASQLGRIRSEQVNNTTCEAEVVRSQNSEKNCSSVH